jgi:addiction module HigA family antidote
LDQTELANRLMVSQQTVSQLLHEEKAVTAEMAIRMSSAVGGTPESSSSTGIAWSR